MEKDDINRAIFLAANTAPVLGRVYAIYPTEQGNWMNRHGAGINVINLSTSITLEFKERLLKKAICFKVYVPASGVFTYIVHMNTYYHHSLWKIMDCSAYCARIRRAHFQFIEKKRARRKMLIGILLRKKLDKFFIRMFVRDFFL
jgi:hypothetical protein